MMKDWKAARGDISLEEMGRIVEDTPCCLDTGFSRKVYDAFARDEDVPGRLPTNLLKTAVDGVRSVRSKAGGGR